MGNGAKAQQKRERNAKDAKGGASSQLKTVRFPLYTAHITRSYLSLLLFTSPWLAAHFLTDSP